ncbi:hypothetical protein BV898_16564 [Hypsibius exemplaris]|uniref:G-protein coupled receptors family 1 profile domain-containing protein n=1 Tax=Hypsibius exemplaris TaxID=2072580 RepID=A0A9X6RLR3_HYPEX|nr:hypothetical protein BV898_16564 [Hypsibius exemplaris]
MANSTTSNAWSNAWFNASASQNFTEIHTDLTSAITTWFTIFTLIATLITNGLIVAVYATRQHLRTPFNAYIVNIAATEILLALAAMPGKLVLSFTGYWPYSALLCSAFTVSQQIFSSGLRYAHFLVTVNRVWAVTYPLRYRTVHTKRVASRIIAVTWVFIVGLNAPPSVLGRWSKGSNSVDRECHNDYRGYLIELALATEIVGFDIPVVMIVLCYPFVLYKLHQIRWKRPNTVLPHHHHPLPMVSVIGAEMLPLGMRRSSTKICVNIAAVQEDGTCPGQAATTSTIANQQGGSRQISRSHDRVLGYFVVGVIVCWTPNLLFYMLVNIIANYKNPTFHVVQTFMLFTYSWVNPVLCYVAMRQLRRSVNDLLCGRRGR